MPHTLPHQLRPAPRVHIHHHLRVRAGHDLEILLDRERVVELACRLGLAVRDVAHLAVHAHLDPRPAVAARGLLAGGLDQRRVREDDRRGQVQHAADGHRVLEGRRVERDERRPRVREGRRAAEGQLEGLLQQEAAEDLEVVAVAVPAMVMVRMACA